MVSADLNALERYVALPDPSYRWKAIAALPGGGYTAHLLELVSQCWRDEGEVRAMDAISGYCRSAAGGEVEIGKFVLAGASKRGWTAWTAAAVDRRVAAVVPVVIDLLNIEASFEHHYRAYGFWAPAIAAYQASGIMRWAGTAELASLLAIEDPFAYRDRLSLPKFVINSAGDQYFLPDSSRFYFDALIGEKYL